MDLKDFDYSRKEIVYLITLCTPDFQKHFTNHSIATLIASELEFRFASKEITLFCYCIMQDHAHILFSLGISGNKNLHIWISAFKRCTAKMVREALNIDSLWQKEFHDHVLRREESLQKISTYIINNPVRKGFIDEWEQYPYSRLVESFPKKTLTL